MFWKDGKLTKAFVTSKAGGICKLRTNQNIAVKDVKTTNTTAQLYNQMQYITSFPTKAGKMYELLVK